MIAPLIRVIGFAVIPVAATMVGAIVAALRPPGAVIRSAIQHFAAGVVFSVVAVELLPDVTRVHDPLEIGVSFAAGLALMLLVERLAERLGGEMEAEGAGEASADLGQLVAIGVDVTIDGLLVGIAFAAGAKEGILLTAALAMELLSLGLAMAASLGAAGASRLRTITIPTTTACLLVVGAVVGDTALRGASTHMLAGVLAFGSAALLYLVTEELLVEAHETKDTTFATSMFFAGFLLFLLLGMLGG